MLTTHGTRKINLLFFVNLFLLFSFIYSFFVILVIHLSFVICSSIHLFAIFLLIIYHFICEISSDHIMMLWCAGCCHLLAFILISCLWLVWRYPDGTYPSVLARNNWWGRNHISFVAGRIWERRDDDNLIRVEYQPFLPDNTSVLHGMIHLFTDFLPAATHRMGDGGTVFLNCLSVSAWVRTCVHLGMLAQNIVIIFTLF